MKDALGNPVLQVRPRPDMRAAVMEVAPNLWLVGSVPAGTPQDRLSKVGEAMASAAGRVLLPSRGGPGGRGGFGPGGGRGRPGMRPRGGMPPGESGAEPPTDLAGWFGCEGCGWTCRDACRDE
ncbi:hypothetical protein L6R50_08870 [Myxococcota bacterium]|nr:hypothetical protein [Myxococcota bacterium]